MHEIIIGPKIDCCLLRLTKLKRSLGIGVGMHIPIGECFFALTEILNTAIEAMALSRNNSTSGQVITLGT